MYVWKEVKVTNGTSNSIVTNDGHLIMLNIQIVFDDRYICSEIDRSYCITIALIDDSRREMYVRELVRYLQ